ncbi:MAG: zeta toxin family protein [Elusimicrobia bacterium]|nr:zeta toxin family protein [Elusimicrobiota bacterium]
MRIKNVYVVAGPNGAGKTTFAKEFLPYYAKCPNFVNADLIAQGLSPFVPRAAAIKAGKLVLTRIHDFAGIGADFGFETTLSGKTCLNLFKRLKARGYKVHIFFLWVPGPSLSLVRIKERVASGGHDVPAEDIERRFSRSIPNFFKLYKPLANSWMLFNNAGAKPVLIAKGNNGHLEVIDAALFENITGEI